MWAKNFKNEPFPKELKRRLIGHKFKFSDFSDEEEDNSGVVEEEDEIEVLEKKKLLPHFEVMNDRGEFVGTRSRMKSERKYRQAAPRCKSVESLRLPQVVEEKKEEEDQKVGRSKLAQFKDRNEFGQRSNRNSETNSDKGTPFTIQKASNSTTSPPPYPNESSRTKPKRPNPTRTRTISPCTSIPTQHHNRIGETDR